MARSWTVQHRTGWCAVVGEPDPDAISDATVCGYHITLRWGERRGTPDCKECLAVMKAKKKVRR